MSYGTVEAAKEILVTLLKKCNCELQDSELTKIQTKVFPLVVQHMVREVVSPNQTVRAQVGCIEVFVLRFLYSMNVGRLDHPAC